MYNLIVIFHVVLALVIIVSIVVFQTSKGSALSMFGGGGDSLFNAASGTSFIKKFTAGCAALFAVTSLLLTIFGNSQRFSSVVQQYPLQQQAAPAAPGAPTQGEASAQAGAPAPAAPAKAAPVKK
ncbi:MAG: preprotein translocase subunit SecG [Elusimicrobia bacterium GWA2_61_42]|nr:MAG: preprotein translocase subunit SecG [Elusimicrobia bacterium GWA2_61_42]OGR75535.1 MAG: preprotein translocase subunit SecG [Elusimicrobia bacterium GWC2_61_25]